VAEAYDAIARRYDRLTAGDRYMRAVLERRYRALFRPGQRLLDVGCGTGRDSLELARRGLSLVALDLSPGMLARLAAALAAERRRLAVAPLAADAASLALFRDASFDGLICNFAAINTVADWPAFAAGAARVLRPGGWLLLHLLSPAGLRRAAVADAADGWTEVDVAGRRLPHRALPLATAVAAFAPPFRLHRAYALGFLWPRRWGSRLPLPLAVALGRLEARLGALPPFRRRGRFHVLELERPAAC